MLGNWIRFPVTLKHRVRLTLDAWAGLTHSEPVHVAIADRFKHIVRSAIISKVVLPTVYSARLKTYQAGRPAPDRLRFLLLRQRYNLFGDEQSGNAYEEHVLSAPLRAADVAEVTEYYYDLDHSVSLLGDRKLVDLVMQNRPDVIILSSYNHLRNRHPNFEVIKSIRARCRIPVVMLWHDSVGFDAVKDFPYISSGIDLNILMDSGGLAERSTNGANFLRLAPTTDVKFFRPGDVPPDIPVSFVGSTEWYRSVREEYLGYLRQQGVEVYQAGGKDNPISLEQYAGIMRRSKITLNFSFSVPGTHQLKARAIEATFCGSLLLENENSETPQFFTPMSDYVVFDSKEDLVDKVRYYLEHENERQHIAWNGYRKALNEYSHDKFWGQVIAKLTELDLLTAFLRPIAPMAEANKSS